MLTGKSTMAFSTGQSWRVLKSWYRDKGSEQGFRRCFENGLNQSSVLSVAQATQLTAIEWRIIRFLFISVKT